MTAKTNCPLCTVFLATDDDAKTYEHWEEWLQSDSNDVLSFSLQSFWLHTVFGYGWCKDVGLLAFSVQSFWLRMMMRRRCVDERWEEWLQSDSKDVGLLSSVQSFWLRMMMRRRMNAERNGLQSDSKDVLSFSLQSFWLWKMMMRRRRADVLQQTVVRASDF